jgi:hypothetical protein
LVENRLIVGLICELQHAVVRTLGHFGFDLVEDFEVDDVFFLISGDAVQLRRLLLVFCDHFVLDLPVQLQLVQNAIVIFCILGRL